MNGWSDFRGSGVFGAGQTRCIVKKTLEMCRKGVSNPNLSWSSSYNKWIWKSQQKHFL